MTRKELDALGEKTIPQDVYYGIHTVRALDNFSVSGYRFDRIFIKAFGLVKKACAMTNLKLGYLDSDRATVILQATEELIENRLDDHIAVDPLQGGAGTSTNMNINEVIANRALELAGRKKSEYSYIHPLRHINLHQSTNDVFPTAIKVSALLLLNEAETAVSELQNELQKKEHQFAHILRAGRTEMQDAVPLSMGRTFAAYADALSRDRWRIFKSRERLRVVNLGGTMIGTGIAAPRDYIFMVCDTLRSITGLNISRSENLIDATQNHDPFVEVSGIMKAHAVNLRKLSADLRLLSSGPRTGLQELRLEPMQAGSSIMPGKINPVIPEMIEQCAVKIFSNDFIITETASQGQLELNAFLPLLGFSLIESLRITINADNLLRTRCISTLSVDEQICRKYVTESFGILTGLLPRLGYDTVEKIATAAHASGKPPAQIIIEQGLMSQNELDSFLTPEQFSKLGFEPPSRNGDENNAQHS
ncbi:MAG: aspartate ammonia-lyase [Candidatus Auribacterota bacterium]|jgi:aspartate ammonia-lyase|nr:aspartate ammonia-lyase [Candidatus Auribacterota bacterium]